MKKSSQEKPRLDVLLTQRGFFDSRAKAQAAIMAGEVYVNGRMVDKAGERVSPDAGIELKSRGSKYVSRGGMKLEGAIRELKIDVKDKVALDVGASTGGFTDCLLKHGARKVYALDVGYGLIHESLRADPRVVVIERKNIRHAGPELFDETPEMAVVDVSFISLKLVLPVLKSFGIREILALVKPQFEAGKAEADRGEGVIRDPAVRKRVVKDLISFANDLGYSVSGEVESSLPGPKGNIEIFLRLNDSG